MSNEITLREKLLSRKLEINNVIDIIQFLTEQDLSVSLPAATKESILRDRLNTLESSVGTQGQDLDLVVAQILEAINSLLGTTFSLADLRSGVADVQKMSEAISAVLLNKKIIIYKPMMVGVVGSVPAVNVDITGLLGDLDASDWSLPQNGGFSVPFNNANPTLVTTDYTEAGRVDVLFAEDHLPIFASGGQRVVAYASAYNAGIVSLTFGLLDNGGNFAVADFPSEHEAESIVVVLPLKSNMSVLPLEGLALTRPDGWIGIRQEDLSAINSSLSLNGITSDSRLANVFGLSALTVADFITATTNALQPTGYNNVVEAILGLLGRCDAVAQDLAGHLAGSNPHDASNVTVTAGGGITATDVQEALGQLKGFIDTNSGNILSHSGLISRLQQFVGKVDADTAPTYTLYGDQRDVLAQGSDLETAVGALNAAVYGKNTLKVASVNANFNSISAAITAIAGGAFGTPSAVNVYKVMVAPGTYTEDVVLADYIEVEGAGSGLVIVNGSVSIPADVHGAVRGIKIISSGAAALTVNGVSDGTRCSIKDVKIQAAQIGIKFLGNAKARLEEVSITSDGISVDCDGASEAEAMDLIAMPNGSAASLLARNNGRFSLYAGLLNGPVLVSTNGLFSIYGGKVQSSTNAVEVNAGSLGLFGGFLSGVQYDIVQADASSVVTFGGASFNVNKIILNTPNVNPGLMARGVAIQDVPDTFVAADVEGALQELNDKIVDAGNSGETAQSMVVDVEEDALVDSSMMQLSMMPSNYEKVMIDSFNDAGSNEWAGTDVLVIDDNLSIMRHSGTTSTEEFYMQTVTGINTDKTVVALKRLMYPSAVAGTNYVMSFKVKISGANYTNGVTYTLQNITPGTFPTGQLQHAIMEYDLTSMLPDGGSDTPNAQLIGVGDSIALIISISPDSAGLDATPTVKSFQFFI